MFRDGTFDKMAFISNIAAITLRVWFAHSPTVQDQRVGGDNPACRWDHRAELSFNYFGVIRLDDPQAVRYP